mgnify:CR=1 FL=1
MRRASFLAVVGLFALFVRAERIELSHDDARCVVETQGARVVSYSVAGQELLWMPKDGLDDDPVWRHGGIPIAWPWFGRIGKDDENIHGYAWKKPFSVKSRSNSVVTLELKTGSADLEYTIRLDAALELELKTFNRSDCDFPMGVAFHPYFRVGERDRTTVEGVGSAAISVTNAIDRGQKFEGTELRREYRIVDSSLGRTIRIVAENSTGVNVWNPGAEKKCPGIIPDDEWRRFVAVEPFAMGLNRFLVLSPGETNVLEMCLSLEGSATMGVARGCD